MDLSYDTAADALRIRLLDSPVAETEQIDSNAVIDWSLDGRVVAVELFGLRVFFAERALRDLLEELTGLRALPCPIAVCRGGPEHGGGYVAGSNVPRGQIGTGGTPVDALRSMLKRH